MAVPSEQNINRASAQYWELLPWLSYLAIPQSLTLMTGELVQLLLESYLRHADIAITLARIVRETSQVVVRKMLTAPTSKFVTEQVRMEKGADKRS